MNETRPVRDAVIVGVGVASATLEHPDDMFGMQVPPAEPFKPAKLLGRRGYRYKDRATQLAMLATLRAFEDAAVFDGALTLPGDGFGVVVSSNLGNLDTVCRAAEVIATEGVIAASPMDLPSASSNIIASSIAVRFGLRGPNVTVCNGDSSGLDAAFFAVSLIRSGRANRVLLVGVEPVNDVVEKLAGRPAGELFDGAAVVLFESEVAATERGAVPRARIARYARRAGVDASLGPVVGAGLPPGLWLVGGVESPPAAVQGVPRHDLAADLGSASGALGVLQIVAGVQRLRANESDPVLATAGQVDDGVSSLLLTAAGAAT